MRNLKQLRIACHSGDSQKLEPESLTMRPLATLIQKAPNSCLHREIIQVVR